MMKIQLRLLSDIAIKINYLLTAFALLSLCFAFTAADEDLSPLAVEDLHQQNFLLFNVYLAFSSNSSFHDFAARIAGGASVCLVSFSLAAMYGVVVAAMYAKLGTGPNWSETRVGLDTKLKSRLDIV
ncbi:hypothetical protein Tco_1333626 [Tanacetum coccineum]